MKNAAEFVIGFEFRKGCMNLVDPEFYRSKIKEMFKTILNDRKMWLIWTANSKIVDLQNGFQTTSQSRQCTVIRIHENVGKIA